MGELMAGKTFNDCILENERILKTQMIICKTSHDVRKNLQIMMNIIKQMEFERNALNIQKGIKVMKEEAERLQKDIEEMNLADNERAELMREIEKMEIERKIKEREFLRKIEEMEKK
jgi:hypothetical protein